MSDSRASWPSSLTKLYILTWWFFFANFKDWKKYLNGNNITACFLFYYSVLETRAVNPGVVSLNPSLAYIPSYIWRNYHQWDFSPVAWKECCVTYLYVKAKKHMSSWTGCGDMTERLMKMVLNPYWSIQLFYYLILWDVEIYKFWCILVVLENWALLVKLQVNLTENPGKMCLSL